MSAFTDRFGHRLTETVQIAARSATSADRVESYGSDVACAAYIERAHTMTRDASGREVLRHALVIIDVTPTVEPTARITMPDGTKPKILNIKRFLQLIPHQEIEIALLLLTLSAALIDGRLASPTEAAVAPKPQVVARQQVAMDAGGLAKKHVATGSRSPEKIGAVIAAKRVDTSRDGFEVSWIDAGTIAAEVVEFQPLRNWTNREFIADLMGLPRAGRDELPVSKWADVSGPKPTAVRSVLLDMVPKAHVHRTPDDRSNRYVGLDRARSPQSHVMGRAQCASFSLTPTVSNAADHAATISEFNGGCASFRGLA